MGKRKPIEIEEDEHQIVATIGLTIICGAMMVYTCGQHGVGWFFLGLMLIY